MSASDDPPPTPSTGQDGIRFEAPLYGAKRIDTQVMAQYLDQHEKKFDIERRHRVSGYGAPHAGSDDVTSMFEAVGADPHDYLLVSRSSWQRLHSVADDDPVALLKRAEKAEAERDRLIAALEDVGEFVEVAIQRALGEDRFHPAPDEASQPDNAPSGESAYRLQIIDVDCETRKVRLLTEVHYPTSGQRNNDLGAFVDYTVTDASALSGHQYFVLVPAAKGESPAVRCVAVSPQTVTSFLRESDLQSLCDLAAERDPDGIHLGEATVRLISKRAGLPNA